MSKIIGFIGKGGTGKSTLTGLFLKYIIEKNIGPVLVVDADPNNCLGEILSIDVKSTIGNVRRDLITKKGDFEKTSVSKYDYCEYALNNSVIETKEFDLITMGRPDGPGCYCYVNNIVKLTIEKLKKNYKLIVIDCEAGLEHLSRKTIGDLNIAFIVSDLSRKGILTGERQVRLMNELEIKTEKNYLIINNVISGDKDLLSPYKDLIDKVKKDGLEFAGIIRNDKNIAEFERDKKSILDLPDDSAAYQDLENIMKQTCLAIS